MSPGEVLPPQGWRVAGDQEVPDLPLPLREALVDALGEATSLPEVVAVSVEEEAEITALRIWSVSLSPSVRQLLDDIQVQHPRTVVLGFRASADAAEPAWGADLVAFVRQPASPDDDSP